MIQWFGLVLSELNPRFALRLGLVQQVEPGVDDVFPQVTAGSGDLSATERWFDFL